MGRGRVLDTLRLSHETARKKLASNPARGRHGCGMSKREIEADRLSGPQAGRLSFKLASTMDSVAEVEAAAERLTQSAGLDEDEGFKVAMAVREAAVNAVLHGNSYDPTKQISASFENTGKSLIITIADEGEGLDPDKIPDPLAPENLLRGTGRGIFLIRSFLDEVHFRQLHPGTELTLVKHLAPAASLDTPEADTPSGLDKGPQDSETK
jgi:serine/threonine-protein kinase RsbW